MQWLSANRPSHHTSPRRLTSSLVTSLVSRGDIISLSSKECQTSRFESGNFERNRPTEGWIVRAKLHRRCSSATSIQRRADTRTWWEAQAISGLIQLSGRTSKASSLRTTNHTSSGTRRSGDTCSATSPRIASRASSKRPSIASNRSAYNSRVHSTRLMRVPSAPMGQHQDNSRNSTRSSFRGLGGWCPPRCTRRPTNRPGGWPAFGPSRWPCRRGSGSGRGDGAPRL